MNGPTLELCWYRANATFASRRGGYLALVLLGGLIGGLAMGSVAAARRTDSSFSVYWASTRPSTLVGGTGVLDPAAGIRAYEAPVVARIAHLPHVQQIEDQSGINLLPLAPDGAPEQDVTQFSPGPGNGYGSVDGLYFDQDRVVALQPYRTIDARLVGVIAFNNAIIADQADLGSAPDNLFTPALTRPLLSCCVNYTESAIKVAGGARYVPAVLNEIKRAFPKLPVRFSVIGPELLAKAQRALKPDAIALGVFGLIVDLACLPIATQLIGRQIRLRADERAVLRAIGAGPGQEAADDLIGILASIVLGSLLAVAVAVALSPIAPLGPVRPVYPRRGLNFDWTVLGFGFLVTLTLLAGAASLLSYRGAPHRAASRRYFVPDQPSRLVGAAAAIGLPVPALTGLRFAVVPGHGPTSVPVRSAILGAVMAVVALVGTVTFGASLSSLVSHPALRSLGSTPAVLGAGLAAGAIAALGLTLIASVRRRRRDLALLKTLGFTERQLAATVAWHSTTAVTIGVLTGVPVGTALGRWLWELFAHDISAVPTPTVPVGQVALIALGALALANLIAPSPAA